MSYCVLGLIGALGVLMVVQIVSMDWSLKQRPMTIIVPRGH